MEAFVSMAHFPLEGIEHGDLQLYLDQFKRVPSVDDTIKDLSKFFGGTDEGYLLTLLFLSQQLPSMHNCEENSSVNELLDSCYFLSQLLFVNMFPQSDAYTVEEMFRVACTRFSDIVEYVCDCGSCGELKAKLQEYNFSNNPFNVMPHTKVCLGYKSLQLLKSASTRKDFNPYILSLSDLIKDPEDFPFGDLSVKKELASLSTCMYTCWAVKILLNFVCKPDVMLKHKISCCMKRLGIPEDHEMLWTWIHTRPQDMNECGIRLIKDRLVRDHASEFYQEKFNHDIPETLKRLIAMVVGPSHPWLDTYITSTIVKGSH